MNQEKIGKFISTSRKKQNLTQEQLAEKLGISKNAVSKWERGLNLPDASIMEELCKILKIVLPSIIMVGLVYFMRGDKHILNGLYFIFPIIYILFGIIYSDFKNELIISMLLTSIAFLVSINLWFNMGTCIYYVLIYNIFSIISFFIKKKITKK